MTFDLRTPNSNLTCILVSSTYTSKIFKIRPTFLKLLCGNQFEFNELWPLTLWTPNSNLTCILVSSTYTSKIFKIRPTFLKLLCGNQFEFNELWPLTFDLNPSLSSASLIFRPSIHFLPSFLMSSSCSFPWILKLHVRMYTIWIWVLMIFDHDRTPNFEVNLFLHCVIYLYIQNIQNPSNIFEVIVRKPIWIYNELWPLTFDLRTPNSNLTCIFVSSTYTSKIFKIGPTFLKLLCGNQFEYIMSCDLWPLRTPNLNLTCIFVSSTYTSKIFKIRPTFLKLLCGNQFEFNELWPLTFQTLCGLRIRTWPVF